MRVSLVESKQLLRDVHRQQCGIRTFRAAPVARLGNAERSYSAGTRFIHRHTQ